MTTTTMLPIIIPAVEESENSKDKIKSKYSLHATPKVYILICKLPNPQIIVGTSKTMKYTKILILESFRLWYITIH